MGSITVVMKRVHALLSRLTNLSVWGLIAGLPGFASNGSSLLLGAGCQ